MTENPANMSNEDLERDMTSRNQQDDKEETLHQENENTSEDPEVKPLEEKSMDMGVDYKEEAEQDLDDLVHKKGSVHNGNSPDPETLKFRESQ